MMEGELLWHTLLVMVASAVDHAQLSALFQLFLREMLSTLSMLIHVSIAVLAQLSVLYQLSLRVESKQSNNNSSHRARSNGCYFLLLYLAKPNERGNACISECTGLNPNGFFPNSQTLYTVEATTALQFQLGRVFAWL